MHYNVLQRITTHYKALQGITNRFGCNINLKTVWGLISWS